jgi:hypothetical protein
LLSVYRIDKHFSFASHAVNKFYVTQDVPIFHDGLAPVKRHLKRVSVQRDFSVHNLSDCGLIGTRLCRPSSTYTNKHEI